MMPKTLNTRGKACGIGLEKVLQSS